MESAVSTVDEMWCDWCGVEQTTGRRFEGRVFCSESCLRQYQRQATTPTVISLADRARRLDDRG
jgi:hypothetical protein